MRRAIMVPDLGPGEVSFSMWLAGVGDPVYEGDRVAELLLGAATIDVVSPGDGRLAAAIVQPGERLQKDQTLGWVES
jgi:pyruvate/2-oxoglutarate dehydrogenase complex dihydrolipoamide acyltransferase (E2) component